ncbi:MAG TPA: carboxypeptidase regulatory-like domain-containing protein [Verrucomicrobiae bacterium]|nr:carboxypeptidase regulatory-like domain-containing protein [Verrucomicrobiae bacterium]
MNHDVPNPIARRAARMLASALVLLVTFFSSGAMLSAQVITGTVVGTVRDASGAAVLGARVSAKNLATGVVQSTVSNSEGNYTITNVPPGTYDLSAQMTGFSTAVSPKTEVQVQQTTRVDFILTPGSTTTEVTVVATAPLVQSTTSDLGHVVESRQIQALPLNGRLFEQLVTIVPGTIQAGWSDFAENPSAAGAVTPTQAVVNGLPWSGNYYMVDGVHNTEPLNAFISITPPLDSIDSFKVETSNPNAEYGSFGGAIVNLAIKSGTNAFHGEVFDFLRNEDLNARDFFAQTRAPYKSNQFGGTFGGPIVKNRVFFFTSYQQLQERQGQTNVLTVPTPLQRQGILTEDGQGAIYDPVTGQPFSNQTIPANRIDPVALKVANLFPLPNQPGFVNNYVDNTVNQVSAPQGDIKIDLIATDRDHLFGRESAAHKDYTSPSGGNMYMMGGPNSTAFNQNAVIGWDHTFSPTMVNEGRFGYNRFNVVDFANTYGIDVNNQLGIPNGNIPGLPYTSGIAQFNIAGYSSTGDPGWTNAKRIANIFDWTDTFSWVHGKHTVKFGGDIQRIQSTLTNSQDDPRGIFNFNANYTSNQGAAGTGNAFASFLLGDPNYVARDFVNTIPAVRMTFAGFFVQDDFRINQKLTINLGLRWDIFTNPVEKYNRQSNFDPQTGLIDVASPNNRGPDVDTYYKNFGPRVGLAYSPDGGKTAIRAAFGMSYFPDNFGATGGTLERNYPFFLLNRLNSPTPFTPFWSISTNGLLAPISVPYTPGGTLAPPAGLGVFYISQNFKQDQAQVWNFSIQRQLPSDTMFSVAYVGTHGVHLYRDLQLNQSLPGPGPIGPRLPFYSIAPNIPTVDQRNGDGMSRYNALQVKVEKRFSHGLSFLASYTFSKTMDNTTTILYPYNDQLNYALSQGFKLVDVPQNFVLSYVYELPFGNGKALAHYSGVAGRLVSGWSLNGITTFQSGQPLFITVANNLLNNNGGSNAANITCSSVATPKQVNQWFDTTCFANPPAYTFGNSGVGHVRGPGLNNTDFSLAKDTLLSAERLRLRVEADFFNVFNTAHFGNPNTTLGNSNFGVISGDRLPPRLIQLGAKFQF